jgi:hypothetical protein
MRTVVIQAPEGAIDPGLDAKVPVSVLDNSLELKETTGLGLPLALDEGLYVARATLPNGTKLESVFNVSSEEGEPITVSLAQTARIAPAPRKDAPVPLKERLQKFEPADVLQAADAALGMLRPKEPNRSWVRIGYGNPFGTVRWRSGSKPCAVNDKFEVEAPEFAQVLMQMKPSLWIVLAPVQPKLPGEPVDKRRVKMVRRLGWAFPHFYFANPDLEMLLRYLASDSQATVDQLAGPEALVAKKAFEDESEIRPLASSVGAYALLRLGRLDDLDWTPRLAERFPWLPDAYAILGEWRARRGEHEAAQAAFLKIPEVGLPHFSMGLSDAVNRLHQYVAGGLPAPEARADILARLEAMAARTDFARPITTYRA